MKGFHLVLILLPFSLTVGKLDQVYNTLTRLIPANAEEAFNKEGYLRAMNELSIDANSLMEELEERIEDLLDSADYDEEVDLKNAREVVRAIGIASKELNAVTDYQRSSKKKRFARPIVDDAKESALAVVDGVRNLMNSLEDIPPKRKRVIEYAVDSFETDLWKLAYNIESPKTTGRKRKRRW